MSLWSWIVNRMRSFFESRPDPAYQLGLSLEYRERTFYVVFASADKYVWSLFLKEGFTHCYVIEKLEHIWIMCDPTRVGLNIVLPYCASEHPLIENMMVLSPDIRVLEIVTKGQVNSFLLRPKLMTCVSVVQYVTAISLYFCITPYSLFKKLLRCRHENLVSVREIERYEFRCEQSKQRRPNSSSS